jgi:hypothetical protein
MATTTNPIDTHPETRVTEVPHELPVSEKIEGPDEQPYSIFTSGEKWLIVSIASIAGIFR